MATDDDQGLRETIETGGRGSPRRPFAPLTLPERYEDRGRIGSGGQGVVHRVFDGELEREVALKTVHAERFSPETRAWFLQEARAAAGLEHPNIVPIHDVGVLGDGRPFYTMRLLKGRSLSAVLDELIAVDGDPDSPCGREWSVVRLVQVLQQVCRALQAAHDRSVVHRDVKPSNVLLGDLGEALLVDWGIARGSPAAALKTEPGVVAGTVHYLSPEQVRGFPADARSDVYAVGVVLYECLTLCFPFDGESGGEVVAAILRDRPAPPVERAPHRRIPPELSDLALRLIDRDPAARLGSARAVADELQAFLEGVRDRQRRGAEAVGLQAAGDAAWRRHEVDLAEAAALRGRVGQLEEIHPRWQPVAEKRELVEARARLAELEASSWRAFLEGVNRYTDALVHVPDHAAVRRALADRFWERFRDAEERRAPLLAETYRMLVERFHDGRLGRELEGRGRLELSVVPAEAELVMHPLLERDLVLVDGPGRPLGRGDAVVEDLPMGRYVIVAAAPGCAAARYPVHVRRCEHWRGRLRLLREGALPDGWAYVPATQAWLGGDPSVSACHPRHLVSLPSFAIRRHAVTLGEYCAFLDGVGADAANAELVPEAVGIGPVCGLDATGRWRPFASERAAAAYAPVPPADRERVPAYGVTRGAAEAFARWEGERLGRRVRLPTADEWELAARGVDERAYPWGDALDMALCAVRESFSGPAYAPPVESVATDCSVYGVRDMAGTIQEFTSSWSDEARGLVEVRGGGWSSGPQSTRCAWRASFNTSGRSVSLGFRLVLELDEADLAEPAGGGA